MRETQALGTAREARWAGVASGKQAQDHQSGAPGNFVSDRGDATRKGGQTSRFSDSRGGNS